MKCHRPIVTAFTLVEILVVTAVIGIVAGVGVVAVTGVRENARQTRLQNDVTVLNNGIDAYRAAGGVIPPGATAEDVLAKLKTVADPETSTAFGSPGPFIDPRLQIVRQSAEEGAGSSPRADYPNTAGYFYVRQGGAPGIGDFERGTAGPVVTETRQGAMPYNPEGEFLTAYADQVPIVAQTAIAPQAVAGEDDQAQAGRDLVKFPRPIVSVRTTGTTNDFFTYSGESLSNNIFALDAEIVAPINVPTAAGLTYTLTRKGQILASTSNLSGSAFLSNIDPESTLSAQVVSRDTNRFVDSDPINITFKAIPLDIEPVFPEGNLPSTINYLNARGEMVGAPVPDPTTAIVQIKNIELLAPKYRSSNYMQAVYRMTNFLRYTGASNVFTNASFAAPDFSPVTNVIDVAWFGLNSQISIFAEVISYEPEFIVAGKTYNHTISIDPTPLTVDVFPLKPIGLPLAVTIAESGDVPVGLRKVYTLATGSTGATPLNPETGGVKVGGALDYSAPITNYPIATYTVVAQATGPDGTEHWFTSAPVRRTYIAITRVPLKYIGLNMFRANINGYVKGSIYMQAGDFAVLNAGATVEGNVYLPGTPAVFLPASGALVVRQRQAYDQSKDALISSNRITGREYDTEGTLADPQADLRKIVDLYGSTDPANYEFRGTETSRIDGKLYRRADPPPVSGEKPALPSEIALSNAPVTVSGTSALPSGSYALTLNNTNSLLQLGTPGNLTKYVFGAGSTWTAGRVEILGPVQIFFDSNVSISGVTFGSSNSIYQTGFVVMSNYSVSIGSGAAVYGQFEARDSVLSVGNDGSFYGSAFAQEVSVAGRGFVDVSGGSDTNSL